MYMRFIDGKEKAVTLSYDDGVIYDKKLIEILNKYELKGTFNINSNMYHPEDKDRTNNIRLKLSEAKKLYAKCINSPNSTLTNRCCNFLLLEEKAKLYKK